MSASATALTAYRAQQRQRVRLLYRHALKTTLSWAGHRDLFYIEANKRRAEFDANKDEADVETIDRLILLGEQKLAKVAHPDPYIVPWAPGGSKWARNAPVPSEVEIVFDFGRENYD